MPHCKRLCCWLESSANQQFLRHQALPSESTTSADERKTVCNNRDIVQDHNSDLQHILLESQEMQHTGNGFLSWCILLAMPTPPKTWIRTSTFSTSGTKDLHRKNTIAKRESNWKKKRETSLGYVHDFEHANVFPMQSQSNYSRRHNYHPPGKTCQEKSHRPPWTTHLPDQFLS